MKRQDILVILLSNINMSVYAANGGQHQHMLLIFYNIFTQAPEISAQVGVQERMDSAHLSVDSPIGARPRPSRAATSRSPKGTGTAKISHATAAILKPQGRQRIRTNTARTRGHLKNRQGPDGTHTRPYQ